MSKGGVGTLRSMLDWSGDRPDDGQRRLRRGRRFDNTVVAGAAREASRSCRSSTGRRAGSPAARRPPLRLLRAATRPPPRRAAPPGSELRRRRGRPLRPRRRVLDREPAASRACRSAPGRSGTSRTRRPSTRRRPTVKGYAKLLDAAAAAIRSRDRKADVVLGGMAELAGSRKAIPVTVPARPLRPPRRQARLRRRRRAPLRRQGGGGRGARPSCSAARVARRPRPQRRPLGDRDRLGLVDRARIRSRSVAAARRSASARSYRCFARTAATASTSRPWSGFPGATRRPTICAWCANSGLLTKSLTPKPSWHAFTGLTGGR